MSAPTPRHHATWLFLVVLLGLHTGATVARWLTEARASAPPGVQVVSQLQ